MGLFYIYCTGCNRPFQWWSGDMSQLCSTCKIKPMKSNCCEAEIIASGLGLICTACDKPCGVENQQSAPANDKTGLTAEEILANTLKPFQQITKGRSVDDQLSVLVPLVITAMKEYHKQESADLLKQIEELKEDRRILKVMHAAEMEIGLKLKAQVESLSQVIESQKQTMDALLKKYEALQWQTNKLTNALTDIKNWNDNLEDTWEDPGYRASDALNKYNQTKQ